MTTRMRPTGRSQGTIAISRHDDVIRDGDAEQYAGIDEAVRELQVLRRRLGITAGVIVNEDDLRRATPKRGREDLAGVHEAGGQGPLRDALEPDGSRPSVEHEHPEGLHRKRTEPRPKVRGDVSGLGDPGRQRRGLGEGPDQREHPLEATKLATRERAAPYPFGPCDLEAGEATERREALGQTRYAGRRQSDHTREEQWRIGEQSRRGWFEHREAHCSRRARTARPTVWPRTSGYRTRSDNRPDEARASC